MSTKTQSIYKRIFSPWVLVITGILFNVFAALITNYFIGINNDTLTKLGDQITTIEMRIDNYWQQRQTIERKLEFLLLLKQQDKQVQDPFVSQYITQFIEQNTKDYQIKTQVKMIDSEAIISFVQQIQKQIVDDIDDIYLDKLNLEKEKQSLTSANSTLMSVALFLQLMGLILILARDFHR